MSPTIVDMTALNPALVTGVTDEPPEEEVLKTAIQIAQPERLRVTLQHICNSSPDAFQIARSLLLVPEKQVKHRTIDRRNRIGDDADEDEDEEDSSEASDNEDDSENSDDASGEEEEEEEEVEEDNGVTVPQTKGVKRLRSKFATCINCSDEFDVTDNGKYSCTWHPGIYLRLLLRQICLFELTESTGDREPDYGADIWTDHDEDCHGRISDLEDEYPQGFIYSCCGRVGDAEGCRIGTHVEEKTSYKRARY